MKNPLSISTYCKVSDNQVTVNGNIVLQGQKKLLFPDFIRQVYKMFDFSYARFFKMDNLCKLGFAAAEIALKETGILSRYKEDETAILIQNRSSSIDTDTDYQQTIQDRDNYFPSPALFVYTLPNILIGEISIKNHLTGESALFVAEKPDFPFLHTYSESLIHSGKAKACIIGWVDFDRHSEDNNDVHYEAFIYIVESKENKLNFEHTKDNIITFYQS